MNYFVEGLQGSGKTTLVRKLSMLHPGYRAIEEGEYSLIELAWCAYMDETAYLEMLKRYPDMRKQIEEKTYPEGNRKIVCYTKIRTDRREFYQDLERYEIYNGRVSYEDFRDIVLSRFKAWDQDGMIFECSLFQNIVEDMILFRCASDNEIIGFYRLIEKALKNNDYHIFYLKTEDIEGNLDVIQKERTDDNGKELWYPLMLGFFNDSPYAKAKGLNGEEAMIEHFRHRQELELRICEEVFIDRYTVIKSKEYSDTDLTVR